MGANRLRIEQIAVELESEALRNAVENLSSQDALTYLHGQAYLNVVKSIEQLSRIVDQLNERSHG